MNIALLLPGQGTRIKEQQKNMWLQNDSTLALIQRAEDQLQLPISEWITEDLTGDTWKAQLVSYVGGMCMYQLYKQKIGLYPKYVLGHSLGELTALTIAGAMDFETGLKLVDIRGKAMQQVIDKTDSMAMMAIFNSQETIQELIEGVEDVYIANYNSKKQTIISGTKTALEDFVEKNSLEGVRLGVSGAFHTPLMEGALESVTQQIKELSFNKVWQTKVISNRLADEYAADSIEEEIASQIVNPVRWKQSAEFADEHGIQLFVDLSPTGMFMSMFKDSFNIFSFHDEENMKKLTAELKDDIEVNKKYDLFSRALGIIVSTKNNCDDTAAYNNIVVSGYNQIKSQIGKESTDREIDMTLNLLDLILRTKKVQENDIEEYKNKLAWEAIG
ncbi:[acyl-carrier-protein] S-malonyltransferase [Bacillus sp. OV322]|uniref:ACP S-malonyltransferase n=1 Tax=Bacillus sp. OV322 TaxID=1882764 RepID=UPI0008E22AA3|nr:ACP S-malonyltransferase [Bacillus sp. OV322]SFC55760.1 [acyl-carrier-protein] S-malonyltransferase [Bacillus sp. OV322]